MKRISKCIWGKNRNTEYERIHQEKIFYNCQLNIFNLLENKTKIKIE